MEFQFILTLERWLMAGKVQGYAKAAKRYQIAAVCGVGMGATGSQMQDLCKANALPADLPVFTLRGGFDLIQYKQVRQPLINIKWR